MARGLELPGHRGYTVGMPYPLSWPIKGIGMCSGSVDPRGLPLMGTVTVESPSPVAVSSNSWEYSYGIA